MTHRAQGVATAMTTGAAVVAADQVTKAWARSVAPPEWLAPWIAPDTNSRASLGLLTSSTGVLSAAMALGIVAVGCFAWRGAVGGRWAGWPAALVVGGALGNLIDRLTLGAVQDFLVFGPIIANVADLGVLVGLGCWAWQGTRPGSKSLEEVKHHA